MVESVNEMPRRALVRRRGEAPVLRVGAEMLGFTFTGAETGGACGLIERVVSPGFQSPPDAHRHTSEDWLCHLLDGRLVFQLDGEVEEMTPGDSLFVPRGVHFRWWNPEQAPARALFLYIPGGFEQFFADVAEAVTPKADRIHDYDRTLADIHALHDRYGIVRA